MSALIDTWLGTRRLLSRIASGLDAALVDRVPEGFANSLHWNIAHLVVTQRLLTYGLCDLPLGLPDELVAGTRKGTTAADWSAPPFAETRALIEAGTQAFVADYRAGVFAAFKPYQTSAGIELHDIDGAIAFNNLHEGIHLGYCLAMKRSLAASAR